MAEGWKVVQGLLNPQRSSTMSGNVTHDPLFSERRLQGCNSIDPLFQDPNIAENRESKAKPSVTPRSWGSFGPRQVRVMAAAPPSDAASPSFPGKLRLSSP